MPTYIVTYRVHTHDGQIEESSSRIPVDVPLTEANVPTLARKIAEDRGFAEVRITQYWPVGCTE